MGKRLAAWSSFVAVIATAAHSAAGPSARLVYLRDPGAETCPDEAAVRAAVAARLGYDPFLFAAPQTLFAEIRRDKSGYVAHIKLVDDSNNVRGARELVHAGDRCEEMIDTMALSISIAIDPLSLTREPEPPAPAPPPAADAAPAPPGTPSVPDEAAPTPPSPARPRREAPHLEGGVGSAAWIGAAPATNIGLLAFARARVAWVSLGAEGRFDAPASQSVDAASVQTSYVGGSLVPCAHVDPFAFCAVASAGDLHATSHDVAVSRDAHAIHVLVGPRVAAELALGGAWSLFSHADLLFATMRQGLALDGHDVYDLPRVSVGLAVGGSVRFF